MSQSERRLAAIMFTDMVGYTALGQRNESLSLALVDEQRKLLRPIFNRHSGREVKTMGDAFLVEFPSALDAVRCAYDIQRATREFNISLPTDKRIHLRVGLHLGDVVESQGDISGDAVNVASRIEPLAEDGGVCLTRQVYDHVQNKFELPLASLGLKALKNVNAPIEVYRTVMPWEKDQRGVTTPLDTRRIAVLPFVSMSPDPADEYFVDGMTEELISSISNIGELSVISRTSAMKFKGGGKTATEIGQELKVGTLLEGSVRKADSRVRVTAQLIDVNNDRHLWSQTYDRELKNIFALQSEIAQQVADSLRVRILSREVQRIDRKPTESTAAYELYLKGRYHWNKRGVEDTKKAMEYFELAVHEDEHFALGYAGQADCCLTLRNNWGIDREANWVKTEAMLAKALEFDPGLAEAHATMGFVRLEEHNLQQAEAEFKEAIGLKPSYATAHQWYAWILAAQLRWDEALEQISKALELDPLSPIINDNKGSYFTWRRDDDKSIEPYRRAVELGMKSAHGDLAIAYGRMRAYDDMRREAAILVELLQDSVPAMKMIADAWTAHLEGNRPEIQRILPQLETHFQDAGINMHDIAVFHFGLGENDKGFEWLERSYHMKEADLIFMKLEPELDGVRTDPRYINLLKRLGLE
ncbi:MAG: adenylate/guanylate cyclase domain-containing protein [Nitrososphaerales archaeon]|jgi:TolB-like protein/Tfp pilus assembly protein PilF